MGDEFFHSEAQEESLPFRGAEQGRKPAQKEPDGQQYFHVILSSMALSQLLDVTSKLRVVVSETTRRSIVVEAPPSSSPDHRLIHGFSPSR